jgi:hypothetical protein
MGIGVLVGLAVSKVFDYFSPGGVDDIEER